MKKYIKLFAALLILMFSSCASFQTGIYSVFVDEESGDYVLANTAGVRLFLENALKAPEEYAISVYERVLITIQRKRTKLRTHSFYLIKDDASGQFFTLSYYGTRIAFRSEGAWILNSNSDMNAYFRFLSGNNRWDVIEVAIDGKIKTEETIRNIIAKIDNGVTYYYRDHIRKRPGVINCNTAIWETIVFTDPSVFILYESSSAE